MDRAWAFTCHVAETRILERRKGVSEKVEADDTGDGGEAAEEEYCDYGKLLLGAHLQFPDVADWED